MGMGYGSYSVDVIEINDLKKICSEEFKALEDAINESEYYNTLDDFAADFQDGYDSCDEKSSTLCSIIHSLFESFQDKTGLELGLSCHNSEDQGDRYDDIDGAYFWLDGVYELTPAAKKLQQAINSTLVKKFFVKMV